MPPKAADGSNMELEFDVKMNHKALYDYMLHHTYTSFHGIFGTVVGVLILFGFVAYRQPIYLIAGIVVIAYLPWTLLLRAKSQIDRTPAFQEKLHYKLTEEGIEVSQGEAIEIQKWEDMYKAISTTKSIIVYTSKAKASIFPKRDLQEKTERVVEIISTHMPPGKVKIRMWGV